MRFCEIESGYSSTLMKRRKTRTRGLLRREQRTKTRWLATGAAAGAMTTFFADPQLGGRRRALLRDRTAGFVRRFGRRSGRTARIAGAYTVGWSKRIRHLREKPKEFDDATLAQKVQSELFRSADAPKGTVDVNVANGVVQLRGEVEKPELMNELVENARRIQGVREVESFLHLPNTPAPMQR
jgi:hypothetical protein